MLEPEGLTEFNGLCGLWPEVIFGNDDVFIHFSNQSTSPRETDPQFVYGGSTCPHHYHAD